MQQRARWDLFGFAGLFVALFVSGCDSGTNTNNMTKTDSGFNTDGGVVVDPDAGPIDGGCDPVASTGCSTGEACGWVLGGGTEIIGCRAVAAIPLAHEQTCDASLQNCAAGFTCARLEGDANAKCYKVCQPTGNVGCTGITGASATYSCQALAPANNQPAFMYGVCVGGGAACDPFDTNACAPTETCSLRGTQTTCQTAGSVTRGNSCSVNAPCARGLICLQFAEDPTPECYQACDEMARVCPTSTDRCLPTSLDFGICQPSCNPLADMCPTGNTCSLVGADALICATAGTSSVGDSCSTMNNCSRGGGICILLENTAGPICYEACALPPAANTCPMGRVCADVNLDFGICVMQ